MIKKLLLSVMAVVLSVVGANCETNSVNKQKDTSMEKKILFINGSPNKNGNTANLAKVFLDGRDYETLNLCDYRINFYGQNLEGDQLDEIVDKMSGADVVVIGSPVYWHNICASVRTVMERFYGYVPGDSFAGKQLFFLYQGEAPTKMMIDDGEYSMSRFAGMYGFDYCGMANNASQAKALRSKLK